MLCRTLSPCKGPTSAIVAAPMAGWPRCYTKPRVSSRPRPIGLVQHRVVRVRLAPLNLAQETSDGRRPGCREGVGNRGPHHPGRKPLAPSERLYLQVPFVFIIGVSRGPPAGVAVGAYLPHTLRRIVASDAMFGARRAKQAYAIAPAKVFAGCRINNNPR